MITINDVKCEYVWDNSKDELIPLHDLKKIWNTQAIENKPVYYVTKKVKIIDKLDIPSLLIHLLETIEYKCDLYDTSFVSDNLIDENRLILKNALANMVGNEYLYIKTDEIDPFVKLI